MFEFKNLKKISIVLAAVACSQLHVGRAHAELILDSSLSYISDSMKSTTTDSSSKMLGSLAMGATFSKGLSVGWNFGYATFSNVQADSTTKKLGGTLMGPRFGYFFGKGEDLSVAFTWLAIANGTYSATGSSDEKWQGSGYQFELGYAPLALKSARVGVKIIYTALSYSSKTDSANTTSTVSYSAGGITPALAVSMRF